MHTRPQTPCRCFRVATYYDYDYDYDWVYLLVT